MVGRLRRRFGRAGFEIGPIGLIGRIVVAAEFADEEGLLGIFCPEFVAAGSEEIAVIFEEFFKVRPGDVGQLDLGLAGGPARLAAFQDILLSGTGGLDHLVVGAGTAVDELIAKEYGRIVNDAGFLERQQVLIAAVWGNEAIAHAGIIAGNRRWVKGRRIGRMVIKLRGTRDEGRRLPPPRRCSG